MKDTQGWSVATTLGSESETGPTLKALGLCGLNPSGLNRVFPSVPRVLAALEPWAEIANAFGVFSLESVHEQRRDIEQLPGLTPAERFDILVRLTELAGDLWLDHDDALTDEDKALIEERMHSHEALFPGTTSKRVPARDLLK